MRWSDGNTDNPRTFAVTEDVTLIAEFDVVTAAVAAEASVPAVTVAGGAILVHGAAGRPVSVYTLQGVCLCRGVADEPAVIAAPQAGVYVVCVDGAKVKVAVQ